MSFFAKLRASAEPKSTRNWLPLAAMHLLAWIAVTAPIFDYDLYWHLAYGREMWQSGQIIQHEPFSHTASGAAFNNRAWLAQWLFYGLQHALGWHALLGFKLLVTSAVVTLMYLGARFLGALPWATALLVPMAVLAGYYRFTERPELFSLLFIAWLAYVLTGWRAGFLGNRWLWSIPPVMVLWDWLHGGIYGFVFLGMVVVLENLVSVSPASTFRISRPLRPLNLVFALTLVAMALNPLGLPSYMEFVAHLQGVGAARAVNNAEYWPPGWSEFKLFYLLLAAWGLWSIRHWRAQPLPLTIASLAFALMALQINRMTGVAVILITPILAALISIDLRQLDWRRHAALATMAVLTLALAIEGANLKFLYPQAFRAFGWKVDDQFFPAGGARFVKAMHIRGNMFNTGHLGGYLAWELYPDYRVFHYNQGAVFSDTYRFVGRPDLLAPYAVDFAFIAHTQEFDLFPAHTWARVYRDPGATLVLRRTPENAELIARFELRLFHPMMKPAQLDAAAALPANVPRLLDEMAVYLAFRADPAMAGEFRRIAERHPWAQEQMQLAEFLPQAAERHPVLRGK